MTTNNTSFYQFGMKCPCNCGKDRHPDYLFRAGHDQKLRRQAIDAVIKGETTNPLFEGVGSLNTVAGRLKYVRPRFAIYSPGLAGKLDWSPRIRRLLEEEGYFEEEEYLEEGEATESIPIRTEPVNLITEGRVEYGGRDYTARRNNSNGSVMFKIGRGWKEADPDTAYSFRPKVG